MSKFSFFRRELEDQFKNEENGGHTEPKLFKSFD